MRTTLYASLRDEFYRLPDVGGIYTPDVLVFRGSGWEDFTGRELGRGKGDGARWYVDVLTAAMLRFPDAMEAKGKTGDGVDGGVAEGESGWVERRYASDRDREMVAGKVRAVMRILCSKGVERAVLCAWGCGAYGNPVAEIARAWRKVLLGGNTDSRRKRGSKADGAAEACEGMKEVVFAIQDRRMAEEFARYFGAGLEIEKTGVDEVKQSGAEDDGSAQAAEELQAKITDLRRQIGQVRSPHLKSRLEEILAGLEKDSTERTGSASCEPTEGEDGLDGGGDTGDGYIELEDEDRHNVSEKEDVSGGYYGSSVEESSAVVKELKKS